MAQGIRLAFLNNPAEGNRIIFYGTINNLPITYNNGFSSIDFEYTLNDSEVAADPFHRVKIGSTIEETANNTIAFLNNTGFQTVNIPIYNEILFDTIWVINSYYAANEIILFEIDSDSTNVVINSFSDNTVPVLAPKYFFQYKSINGVAYKCEIYQKNFSGTSTEIIGRAILDKAECSDHLDIFRGSGLSLTLEANPLLKFEDLYLQNENDFTVKFYIENALIYQGFLKPEGVFESWTDSIWNINLDCTDRLGDLENLSFINTNGLPFSGKMSVLDVIRNCLNRTGLQLKINTFCNVFYYGLPTTPDTDSLAETYVNVNRFISQDENTIMSCKEVLESLLRVFNAVITQHQGEWFIYRPSDFYENYYPLFKRYEINGNYIGLNEINLNQKLGSQIDKFYPHHCNKNQTVEIKGAVSSFRLGYKYGFLRSILGNGNLEHEVGTSNYYNWNYTPWPEGKNTGYLIIDPISAIGMNFKAAVADPGETYTRNSALVSDAPIDNLLEGYSIEFKTRFKSYGFPVSMSFTVRVGSYYLNQNDGSWSSTPIFFRLYNENNYPNTTGTQVDESYERSFSIMSQPLPEDGDLEVRVDVPFKAFGGFSPIVELKSVEIINTFSGDNVVGEFHTVSRINPPSSNVRNNETVLNGDSGSFIYNGAFLTNELETLTQNWYRQKFGGSEVKPILRISAEDELRMFQKPLRVFSGDVMGMINYLSCIKINNIQGVFMPISWKFDTFKNILTIKSMELYTSEIYDVKYEKTFDYGETIKPTIVG